MVKQKRKKVLIIHFQPLELYPPIMNIVNFLQQESGIQLTVISNRKKRSNILKQYLPDSTVRIFRPGIQSGRSILRYLNYFSFYLVSLLLLIWYRPKIVFYFETLSSWPALIYKKIFGRKIKLMVHYHEYTEPQLYEIEMVLAKWMYKFEISMYSRLSWISHTNEKRLDLFRHDNNLYDIRKNIFHIIPNYPPTSWILDGHRTEDINEKEPARSLKKLKIIRLVFVGSLGFKNMYLQELLDWITKYKEEFTLDIYSYNIKIEAKEVLASGIYPNVTYHEGCNYFDLPGVLRDYDIGLDIYKPYALNHIHGVSNKVFEYLACGLDVWYTTDKPLTSAIIRNGFVPKVVPVAFNHLDTFDYKAAISREGLKYKSSPYTYEKIYPELLAHILN